MVEIKKGGKEKKTGKIPKNKDISEKAKKIFFRETGKIKNKKKKKRLKNSKILR